MSYHVLRDCVSCGATRRHHGRGLCRSCTNRHYRAGTISDWPRLTRPREDTIGDAEALADVDAETAADRMGMTAAAISKALYRAGRPDLAARYNSVQRTQRRRALAADNG